ncbi:MAG: T9SS type A sorting domain-containing protein [Nonlabens sp.]
MKKITLSVLFSFIMYSSFAQSSCANAAALNFGFGGVNSVTSYGSDIGDPDCNGAGGTATGVAWFVYTPSQTGVLNLDSDQNGGLDTTVNVYTGACGALSCVGNADDINYPNNLATDGTFDVTANTTYYIAWDNRWDRDPATGNYLNNPFDFTATFTAVTGPPGAVTTPSPVDMATNIAIDVADNNMDGAPDNAVPLSWAPDASASPATEYDILYGEDPAALNNLTANATFTSTSVRITGNDYNTTYYWSIVAINGSGSTQGPVWSFTTEAPTAPAPTNATTPTPLDGAVNVTINTADSDMDGNPDNAVDISWAQDPNGQQPTAYTVRLGTDPAALNTLTTTFTATAARFINQDGNTTYYWQIVPTNQGSEAANQPIWSYTTEPLASIDENSIEFFTLSPNPASSFIELKSELDIIQISIFNALGQKLLDNKELDQNKVDVSMLTSGTYFINAVSEKGSQTIQFIKE